MSIIRKNITLILLHLVFLAVAIVNFPFGKYFLGWDSLSPEFNFTLNFQRVFSAFWQENYGLGLLGGHGFAATLPHTLITFLLSFVLPQEAIRPAFTLFALYLGGLGTYFLIKLLFEPSKKESLPLTKNLDWISLFGAVFYMFNLGTVQMFYVQLETFIAHFAALPWLFFAVIKLLKNTSLKHLVLFFVINFFATLQGFIPSLFVAYFVALTIFLFAYAMLEKSSFLLKRGLLIIALTLAINAYWLFPLIFYQVTRANIFLDSYNNLISTPHFIDVNKKYGDLINIPLLKGFLFDSYQLGEYILQPWISHLTNSPVLIVGYGFSLLILIGILFSIIKMQNNRLKALLPVFLFFFSNLAIDVFPFSYAIKVIYSLSPTYEQAFRTPFTKFGLGLAFSYAIFASIGLLAVLYLLERYLDKKRQAFILITLFLLLGYYMLPIFQGHLLYKKLMINLPQAYFDIFDYFKDKEDARIADFPQGCPEGWSAYNWGYFGSGFYWYAIKQPFLSRTFDVWSNNNERYYWEISQALKEQDYAKVDALLQKYNVKWVLFDPNTLHCRNEKWIFNNQQFFTHLENSPNYSLLKIFDQEVISPVRLYENKRYAATNFISFSKYLPNANSVEWTENDSTYYQLGNYVSNPAKPFDFYYPFRSLFTKRKTKKDNFAIENMPEWITFKTQLPPNLQNYLLKIKNYSAFEKGIPMQISLKRVEDTRYKLYARFLFPEVYIDAIKLVDFNYPFEIGEINTKRPEQFIVKLNGEILKPRAETPSVYEGVLNFVISNTLTIADSEQTPIFVWNVESNPTYQLLLKNEFSMVIPSYETGIFSILIPKIDHYPEKIERFSELEENTEIQPCSPLTDSLDNRFEVETRNQPNFIRLMSKMSSYCLSVPLPDAPTSFGYLLELKTRNIQGNPLSFSLKNDNQTTYEKVPLEKTKQFTSSYHVIPPAFPGGLGYELSLENISENREGAVNDFAGFSFWHIPYTFLNTMALESPTKAALTAEQPRKDQDVEHPSETKYIINTQSLALDETYVMNLSQSFDDGWKAYQIKNNESRILNYAQFTLPFLFGEELKEHVLVNDWENGWLLNNATMEQLNNRVIIIIYLPQYLQYVGFGLLVATCLPLLRKLR